MMSDDEDNQSLIDEIQALEHALDQKQILDLDNQGPSTSGLSHANATPGIKKEQNVNNDIIDEDGDLTIDDPYESYSCNDLQDLLELNKTLIESLTAASEKIILLLEECNQKKRLIEEQINKETSSWQTKIVTFNAGMPYFKDKNYYSPRRNEDTETKIRNGELRLAELQRIHRWNQIDKSNLLKAIRHEVTLTLLNRNDPEEAYIDNTITKTSQLPNDVKKAIGPLGSMKFDWLKIANNMPDNKHSAEECEVMWNVYLHPDINKQKWTAKEDKNLNRIVEEHEFEDWDAIAKALNTNRSSYQCFIRYNTNNYKNLMKGQSWSPYDDKILVHLVSKLKIGDYIPWGYIASCMSNWTKQQVYFRWTYSLAPHLKKGRFSEEEDRILCEAVEKYGPNFSKIAALEMTNRTNIQLKEHYQTLLSRSNSRKKVWSFDEDEKLFHLQKLYGSNWAQIVKEMPGVTRIQARHRYATLLRYHQKGVNIKDINRTPKIIDPLSHTTMTYTTNSPWSRENKEIYVKHLKIDDQLINFFKKETTLRKMEKIGKSYHPDKLQEDTKKIYNILQKLNANLNIPDVVHDDSELSEMNLELLASLQSYIVKLKVNVVEDTEKVRLEMFGPADPLSIKKRFIPPLPFGFCLPRFSKTKVTDIIDTTICTDEFHQIELTMILEPDHHVSEYLGEDIIEQFEKFKDLLTNKKRFRDGIKKAFLLKCKPFARSVLFCKDGEENNEVDNLIRPAVTEQESGRYDWELNKIVRSNTSVEKVVLDGAPLQTIEPNRTTLRTYQDLLLVSANFPDETSNITPNLKLTPRGREALSLFKNRYQQLFHIPTGLSRIIPPDIVDESAFLPVLEKFKKKNLKTKRRKRLKKTGNETNTINIDSNSN